MVTSALPSYNEKGLPGPDRGRANPTPTPTPTVVFFPARPAHHPREHLITSCQVPWGQTNEAASRGLGSEPRPSPPTPTLLSLS